MIPFLSKKIYLTRTKEDNLNFLKCFNLLKPKYNTNEVFVSVPLLDIFFVNIKELYIEETNLIFTSRYGIKAISEVENLKLKKTYCVGKSTAEVAKQSGFKNICYPEEGDARSLINLILKDKDMLQTFHYLRGNEVSFDLKKELSDLGYKIKETIIYKQKNNKLSDKQKSLIMSGEIKGIIFFSASVAKIFCKDIKIVPDGFLFFCISDRVADNIIKSNIMGDYIIKVANKPDIEGIIDLICNEFFFN